MPSRVTDDEILLAQIEAHRTEVFYDMGPMLHGQDFLKRLPGSVKRTITWWIAPNPSPFLNQYDLVVGNFPAILEGHQQRGCRTAYFSPAHDPALNEYAANLDRPVDVIFVGSYSQHHRRRNELLSGLAEISSEYEISMHLHISRRIKLAESPLGRMLPLARDRRPGVLRKIAKGPLFGRDLYEAMSRAKIALNGSGEIAGNERGNMRCFEAMGCRNLLLADEGIYPGGMDAERTLLTYSSTSDAIAKIRSILRDPARLERIAAAGFETVSSRYSKEQQWRDFQEIAA